MTEITFTPDKSAAVKVLLATTEETLNYGIAGNIIGRALFNQVKALAEREDEGRNKPEEILLQLGTGQIKPVDEAEALSRQIDEAVKVRYFARAAELQAKLDALKK